MDLDYRDKQIFTEEQELRNHNATVLLLLLVLLMQVLKMDSNALVEIALRGVG